VLLSAWNEVEDTFEHADQTILDELAGWLGMTSAEFGPALQIRVACLEELSQDGGVGLKEMYEAVEEIRKKDASPDA